jgi:hypothetical protein
MTVAGMKTDQAYKDVVYINIEFFTGQAEGDAGYPYYVASCDELYPSTEINRSR